MSFAVYDYETYKTEDIHHYESESYRRRTDMNLQACFTGDRMENIFSLAKETSYTPNMADLWIRDLYMFIKVIYKDANVFDFCEYFDYRIAPHFKSSFSDKDQQKWKITKINDFVLDTDKSLLSPTVDIYVSTINANEVINFTYDNGKIEMLSYWSGDSNVPNDVNIAKQVIKWLYETDRKMHTFKFIHKEDNLMCMFGAVAHESFVYNDVEYLVWMISTCKDKSSTSEAGRLDTLSAICGENLIDLF